MTEFRIVTEEELRPVLQVLGGLDWPVPFGQFPDIFERLGWEKQRRKGGVTNLPVSLRLVSVGELRGEIAEIRFRISDTLPGTSPENKTVVAEQFPAAVAVVANCLGGEPAGELWASSGARWDFEDGRQLNLIQGEDTIALQYWSKRMADIERHERSHGVDPAHNLDDRE
ncbi:DUF6301 family protein [Microbacterium natoriense]|uniref:DUF6301 family protein n=1 Tax=Microbacterium natoriense TaxID=284570 RepID=UPI0027D87FC5|nr:DUF6301 family protein [Microbacterium natoriense]